MLPTQFPGNIIVSTWSVPGTASSCLVVMLSLNQESRKKLAHSQCGPG